MKRWLRAIAWLVVLPACADAAASQSRQQPELPRVKDLTIAQADLKGYQNLLRRYCAGDATAIDRLLPLDPGSVLDGITIINTSLDDTRPWPLGDIKSAVLMHTEAVLRLVRQSGNEAALMVQLDAAGRVLVRGADPFLDREDPEVLKRNSEVRAFAARWYVAISRLLRDRTRFNAAHLLLAWGRKRAPGDAAVLYESGVMEEFIATHPSRDISRNLAGQMTLSHGDSIANDLLKDHNVQLVDAERWLRDSIARDPGRLDAQLHLGRVLMLLGRDDDAARLFDGIATPPEHAYVAHLFRGAIEERRGSLDAARDAYRTAAAMNQRWQVAAIALSQVVQRQGRGEESRALLDALLTQSSSEPDPWWRYFVEESEAVFRRVEALFKEVNQ